MLFNYIDPVAIKIGGIEVRWYAICILTGIIIALWCGIREGRRLGINSDFFYLGICIVLPVAIFGARFWYFLFNMDDFPTFASFFGVGNGSSGLAGLAIQGGVIAAIIASILFCKKKHVSFFKVVDLIAPGFLIGQICGRWGNFCNHELYGSMVKNESLFKTLLPSFITDNMWIDGGNLLPGLEAGYYHPVFLYESGLNFVGLIIMLVLRRKSKRLESGDFIGFYLIWYGIVRWICESFRHEGEVLLVGNIRVSILVSIVFIICGVLFLILKRVFTKRSKYQVLLKEAADKRSNTIIFDNDGTIIDSREWISRSFISTFNQYFPDKVLTDDELDSFFGPTLLETFSKYESDPKRIDEMIETYRRINADSHDQLVKIFPGVKSVIKTLHRKGYNLAIVSSKRKETILRTLKYFGIDSCFDVIIGYDDVKNCKPAPDGIEKALSYFTNVKNPLYVGDTKSDMLAGHAANCKTVGALYGVLSSESLEEGNPNYFLDSFNDLLVLLCE